jgi:hypothetical protein
VIPAENALKTNTNKNPTHNSRKYRTQPAIIIKTNNPMGAIKSIAWSGMKPEVVLRKEAWSKIEKADTRTGEIQKINLVMNE